MVLFLVEQVKVEQVNPQAERAGLEVLVKKDDCDFRAALEKRIVAELEKFEKDGKNKVLLKWLEKAKAEGKAKAAKAHRARHAFCESTNYDFRVESAYLDKGLSTPAKKAYYELGAKSRENSAKAGNSYESYTSRHESAVLKEGQKLQQEAKTCHLQRKAHITIDCREKEARDSIKLFSPATWLFMYEVNGKIEFS